MTMYHRILIAMAFIVVIALVASCARPQPYGEGIWIGVREMER